MKILLTHFQQVFDVIRPKKIIDTLFMGYVMLIIIPILILGILFTGMFTYHLSEQTKSNAQYSMQYAEKILDSQLETIYNASYNFMYDDNILNFEKYSNYSFEQALSISKAETALRRVQVQNEIIDDIFLYYNRNGIVISATQGSRNRKTLFGMEQKELYDFFIANNGKFVSIDSVSESGLKQNYVLYIKAIDKKRTSGDIYSIFMLNNELIKDAVHLVNTHNAGHVLLLDDNYNCLVYDGNDKFTYTDEVRDRIKSLTERRNGRFIKTHLDGNKFYLLTENIALTKLKVCFIINGSHYVSKLWGIWIIILLVSLFIMVMSIFVARVYSRKIYRPIGNIINIFKPEQKEYGEKSELAFFEEKFVEIQTMQNKLAEYNDIHTQNIRVMLVYNFLKGYMDDALNFKETISNYDICFDADSYSIVLIKVDRMYEISKKIQMYHYQKFVSENIIQSLTEVCPHIKEGIYEFYDGEYIGLIICRNSVFDLEKAMCEVQNTLKEKLEITLSVCISDEVEQIHMLPKAYKSVCAIMSQIKLCDYGYLITADKYKDYHRSIDFNQFEKNMRTFIKSQKYEEVDSLIDEVFMGGQIFYTEIIQIYTGIIKVIVDIANEENCYTNMFRNENLLSIDKLNEFNTVGDVVQYLKNACKEAGESIAEVLQSRNKMYDRIMEYISNNYMLDIGLQNMAEEFGLSKSYFSRCLKEVTGKNYIELLNGYRIEKAKELINNDYSLKLSHVAELVGFVSYRTFSSAFKRFEGQSPETYRRNV